MECGLHPCGTHGLRKVAELVAAVVGQQESCLPQRLDQRCAVLALRRPGDLLSTEHAGMGPEGMRTSPDSAVLCSDFELKSSSAIDRLSILNTAQRGVRGCKGKTHLAGTRWVLFNTILPTNTFKISGPTRI